MAHGEEWLRSLGVPRVEFMLRPEKVVVRQFYERIGYEVEDQIVMSRGINGRQV